MKQRIAVLGAGPMGLAVAYELARQGHEPVVFEADDRIGGMTAAFDFSGMSIERFYHFHCTSDAAFLKVLEELGLSESMRWMATRMGYWFQKRLQPWGNPMALLKFSGLSFGAKFRYGLHAFCSTKRNDYQPLDHLEATAWIQKWVGQEAYDVLWKQLFERKFYQYTQSLSAAWVWSRIRRVGRSRYNLFREKLGYLEGGSETLLQAMRADIEQRGGQILLKSPINRVVIEEGRVKGVQVANRLERFDKVISTIPIPYVPALMPDLPAPILAQFAAVKNIAVVCVIVKLRRAVSENFWTNINDPDMEIPGLVEYTNLRPLEHHIIYAPFYMPGEHPHFADADAVFLEKTKRYLKMINPQLTDEDFVDIRASRYRYAQPICGPGFLNHLPKPALPIEGLWVADTSYYYPEDRGISESIDFGRKMALEAIHSQEV